MYMLHIHMFYGHETKQDFWKIVVCHWIYNQLGKNQPEQLSEIIIKRESDETRILIVFLCIHWGPILSEIFNHMAHRYSIMATGIGSQTNATGIWKLCSMERQISDHWLV